MLLKVGSRGEDVKAVQQFLGLGADGIFGKGTEQAVKDFQSLNGLDADVQLVKEHGRQWD